jgi:hypothetical protein
VLTARLAYGHAVDALLAGYGETSPQPKWRVRRMRAAAPGEIPFEDFWAIETMRDLDPADPLPWIKAVVRACQDLAAEVEL